MLNTWKEGLDTNLQLNKVIDLFIEKLKVDKFANALIGKLNDWRNTFMRQGNSNTQF